MNWKLIPHIARLPRLRNPVLLEGLPGIGNVGKIAVDFLIEELHAKKMYSFFSHRLPHSVFVNDDDLVELPSLALYYKKGKRDLLILTGDVQPIDEESTYSFCEKVLEIARSTGVCEIITTGGIGLQEVPEKPRVYVTGTDAAIIAKYSKGSAMQTHIHHVVGPVIGVSGLLVGLSGMEHIPAAALLAETFGHPLYLGVKGAREILKVLNAKLGLHLNIGKLSKEIEQLEQKTIKRTKEMNIMKEVSKRPSEATYIG